MVYACQQTKVAGVLMQLKQMMPIALQCYQPKDSYSGSQTEKRLESAVIRIKSFTCMSQEVWLVRVNF
jgi:hypothetical protein